MTPTNTPPERSSRISATTRRAATSPRAVDDRSAFASARRLTLRLVTLAGVLCIGACTSEPPAPPVTPPAGVGSTIVHNAEPTLTAEGLFVEQHPGYRSETVVEAGEDTARLAFRFEGESPLRVGSVIAGEAGGGYIARVTALEPGADGTVVASLVPAALDELFAELDFDFNYDPVETSDTMEAVPVDEEVGGSRAALGGSCNDVSPCKISGGTSFGGEIANCRLQGGAEVRIEPYVTTKFKAVGQFKLRGPTLLISPRGEVKAGIRLFGEASGSMSCEANFAELLGRNCPPGSPASCVREVPKIVLAKVFIGPVPVTLTATPILEGSFNAAFDVGAYSAEAGVVATAEMDFGVRNGRFADPTPRTSFAAVRSFTTERPGSASASAEIRAGVRLTLTVGYQLRVGLFRLNLSASGYAELTGSLGAELEASAETCEWSLDIPWSVDLKFGAKIDLIVWRDSKEWPAVNLFSGSLGSAGGTLPLCTPAAPGCLSAADCTGGQTCCAGACVAPGCNDGNACTDDACGATGCANTPNALPCSDGTFCNGVDQCAAGSCSSHSGSPCSGAATCNETLGACEGCAADADCGGPSYGGWGPCGGGAVCGTAGTYDRDVTQFTCDAGACRGTTTPETAACVRPPDAPGTACPAGVCDGSSSCVACASGSACAPVAECRTGTIACGTGAAVCTAAGNLPAGTTCGSGSCDGSGNCVAPCAEGLRCSTGVECERGATSCATGTAICVRSGDAPNGTSCGAGGMCAAGACVAAPACCDPGLECCRPAGGSPCGGCTYCPSSDFCV